MCLTLLAVPSNPTAVHVTSSNTVVMIRYITGISNARLQSMVNVVWWYLLKMEMYPVFLTFFEN